MAQAPFRHDLPTHAQSAAMREKAEAEKAIRAARLARWRTIGIWAFGMTGSAMIGAIVTQNFVPFPRDVGLGVIAGACTFGCARLCLSERRFSTH
jgi:hypothetical protein